MMLNAVRTTVRSAHTFIETDMETTAGTAITVMVTSTSRPIETVSFEVITKASNVTAAIDATMEDTTIAGRSKLATSHLQA